MWAKIKAPLIVVVIAVALTLVGGWFLNMQTDTYTDKIAVQLDEIDTLKTKITVAKANEEGNQQAIVSAVTGIDIERKLADDEIFKTFVSKVMTWTGYEQYVQMRKDIMAEYNISGASKFMMTFLPSRPQGYRENAADISCQLDSMESVCYHIDDTTGVYSYFTEVSCISAGAYGGNAVVKSIFTYTVSEDGKIGDIMAYNI